MSFQYYQEIPGGSSLSPQTQVEEQEALPAPQPWPTTSTSDCVWPVITVMAPGLTAVLEQSQIRIIVQLSHHDSHTLLPVQAANNTLAQLKSANHTLCTPYLGTSIQWHNELIEHLGRGRGGDHSRWRPERGQGEGRYSSTGEGKGSLTCPGCCQSLSAVSAICLYQYNNTVITSFANKPLD